MNKVGRSERRWDQSGECPFDELKEQVKDYLLDHIDEIIDDLMYDSEIKF